MNHWVEKRFLFQNSMEKEGVFSQVNLKYIWCKDLNVKGKTFILMKRERACAKATPNSQRTIFLHFTSILFEIDTIWNVFADRNLQLFRSLIKNCDMLLAMLLCNSTVKPVYNDHPWNKKILAIVDRWSLFRGHFYNKVWNLDFKMVVIMDRWSLFGGGR